jgi:hypothetical protein
MGYDSDEGQQGAKHKPGLFSSLFCAHKWERYGSGYDSFVKCAHCDTTRDEKPGEFAPW